jgi:hypothetical protein
MLYFQTMGVTVLQKGLLGLVGLALAASARADEPAAATPADAAPAAAPVSKPRAPVHAGHAYAEAGPPGFETLADGSTRLSIELSQAVGYEAKATSGRVTYVVKGARAAHRNDYNPLVTVAFNTPVTSARLTPHGRDLWFVVDLRAPVKPEVTTDAAKDGGMVLQIAFPKGDYLPASSPPSADASSAQTESAPAGGSETPGSAGSPAQGLTSHRRSRPR